MKAFSHSLGAAADRASRLHARSVHLGGARAAVAELAGAGDDLVEAPGVGMVRGVELRRRVFLQRHGLQPVYCDFETVTALAAQADAEVAGPLKISMAALPFVESVGMVRETVRAARSFERSTSAATDGLNRWSLFAPTD